MKKLDLKKVKEIAKLRRNGYSISEISSSLNIPKTTVFRYTCDVDVLPEFQKNLLIKRGGSLKRKLEREKLAEKKAKLLIKDISDKELLLFLSALYWAEGSKNDFGLSNTDPSLIKVFVHGLKRVMQVDDKNLSVSVRIYEDLDREKCLSFWSQVVGIPKEQFISVNILKGKKMGKLEYGMCRVRVKKGGELLKTFVAINKLITNRLPL